MSDMTVVTLGAFRFSATSVEVGALPRTIGVTCNALSPNPVQTTDFTSGYRPITIEGYLRGIDSQGETAAAHLVRLMHNLRTEVAKDTNTLTIAWPGGAAADVYTVYKNEDVMTRHDLGADVAHRQSFAVTLNCLP